MRSAPRSHPTLRGIALIGVLQACASHSPPSPEVTRSASPRAGSTAENSTPPASPSPVATAEAAPSAVGAGTSFVAQARALVEESKTAAAADDYSAARERARAAVALLLARPESERDADLLAALGDAGRAANAAQDPATARDAWEVVHEVRSRTLREDDQELSSARVNLAVALHGLGDREGARKLFEENYEALSRTLPDDHPTLQIARQNLGVMLLEVDDVRRARELFEKVVSVLSRTLPEDDPDLQGARGNLAVATETLGDVAGARALYESILASFLRTRPADHPDVLAARTDLAGNLRDLGDLEGARELFEKVLVGRARILPPDHLELLEARENLATILSDLGDDSGARSQLEEILSVASRKVPEDHPLLQRARQNLAAIEVRHGEFEEARALAETVAEVYARTLPEESSDVQMARTALADQRVGMKDFRGALEIVEGVLAVRERTLPENHPEVLESRGYLAQLAFATGDPARARDLGERVVAALEASVPEEHPGLARARLALATAIAGGALRRAGSGAAVEDAAFAPEAAQRRCTELVRSLARGSIRAAQLAQLAGSGREAEERCAKLVDKSDFAASFAQGFGAFGRIPELEREAFALIETLRGAAVVSASLARRTGAEEGSPAKREALRRAREDLASLVRKGATSEAFERARRRRDDAERALAGSDRPAEEEIRSVPAIDAASVAAALGDRDAVVAFRRITRTRVVLDPRVHAGEPPVVTEETGDRLLAFVVARSATQPDGARLELVDLGPIDPVVTIVRAWRDAVGVGAGRGIGGPKSGDRDAVARAGAELRRAVFDPLLPSLAGIERLVVVPDDVLHLVPLDALPAERKGDTSDREVLGDRWRIETRTTLAELVLTRAPPAGADLFVGVGGVGYGAITADSRGAPAHFEALPATRAEVEGIAASFGRAFAASAAPRILAGDEATKERIFELAPATRWLHVATHGWSEPDSIRSWVDAEPLDAKLGVGSRRSGTEQVRGLSPLLLCGIALAGANGPDDVAGRASGIATAEELESLDLANCEMAVLSACDTNVGERRAGLGVASLQRSLQVAGARSVVTSLWKVPDEPTKDLMLDFYRRLWIEKEPKWRALREAKKSLRDARDEHGRPRYAPRDWAAWTLTGEPD